MTSTTGGSPPLQTAFTTRRDLDFFTIEKLRVQIGHPEQDWPLVVVKELLDNALDACEEAGVQPAIVVTVDDGGVEVADNGRGIPEQVVRDAANYEVRVSSREAYQAPSRGRQGNALKTIIAMPFVLDGAEGRVTVRGRGVRHDVRCRVDRIEQRPKVTVETTPEPGVTGTAIRVHWPAADIDRLRQAAHDLLLLLDCYRMCNPHLALAVHLLDHDPADPPADQPGWRKWTAADPSCPRWYTEGKLRHRIACQLSKDRAEGRSTTVRELVATFRGMRGSAKQKAVLTAAGLSRADLSELTTADGSDVDAGKVSRLLAAMQAVVAPVKPARLGVIGEAGLRDAFADLSADLDRFRYRKLTSPPDAGVPWVVEAAFAPLAADSAWRERQLYVAVNWSAAIEVPFGDLGDVRGGHGRNFLGLLAEQRVKGSSPVVLFVHLAHPCLTFSDHGKARLACPPAGDHGGGWGAALADAVVHVSKMWAKKEKTRERTRRAVEVARPRGSDKASLKQAATEVMAEAYRLASGGGAFPAHARQIFYQARPLIQRLINRTVESRYFTQTLLPDYMAEHPDETAGWDVVYDARGRLLEPHTGRQVELGTLGVRGYLSSCGVAPAGPYADAITPQLLATTGPRHRYRALLFVEKEGFHPLFRRVRLADRFDVAILSTKGMPTTACRKLVEELCGGDDAILLLVLHDFDEAGLKMVATLRADTRRYRFRRPPRVVDLGVRLADAAAYQLDGEEVEYSYNPAQRLRRYGATEAEVHYLYGRPGHTAARRVELNAFTSGQLVEWVEGKLREHGCGEKVVPDAATLERTCRDAAAALLLRDRVRLAEVEARRLAADLPLPADLADRVRGLVTGTASPWDAGCVELVAGLLEQSRPATGG